MRRSAGTLLVGLCAALLGGCAEGPVVQASLRGWLTEGPWLSVDPVVAVPGARVEARDPAGALVAEAVESPEGYYTLSGLPAWGELELHLDGGPGWAPVSMRGRTVRGDLFLDLGVLHLLPLAALQEDLAEVGLEHRFDPSTDEGGLLLVSWQSDEEVPEGAGCAPELQVAEFRVGGVLPDLVHDACGALIADGRTPPVGGTGLFVGLEPGAHELEVTPPDGAAFTLTVWIEEDTVSSWLRIRPPEEES